MNDQLCSNCHFWTGDRTKGGWGECHRLPPVPAGLVPAQDLVGRVTPNVVSAFPTCAATTWCGEWKANMEIALQ
jgi:hypothetical protein